jgi:hypothetical protein
MDNGDDIESKKSFEISAILQENQFALESDSTTTDSSSATPFLSPVGELTDDSPSDEMSAYLTPPNEPVTERVAEGQGVDSSPECDRSDNRRRYAFPEIQLGDIHKVNSLVIFYYFTYARVYWIKTGAELYQYCVLSRRSKSLILNLHPVSSVSC